jgi:hypothetical protein
VSQQPRLVSLLCLLVIAVPLAKAQQAETIILDQPDLPVTIDRYDASYRQSAVEGIRHEVTIKNRADVTLEAIEVAFVSLDAFDEFLDFGIGFSRPGIGFTETSSHQWM